MVKCSQCSRRVSTIQVIGNTCKCGKVLCDIHKYPEEHNCPIDYRASAKEILRAHNPPIIASKIVPI